jgi:hypothetical protein
MPQLIMGLYACFLYVDNQCHILCLVIYMLQPAHMLNKDIRSLSSYQSIHQNPFKGLDVFHAPIITTSILL